MKSERLKSQERRAKQNRKENDRTRPRYRPKPDPHPAPYRTKWRRNDYIHVSNRRRLARMRRHGWR